MAVEAGCVRDVAGIMISLFVFDGRTAVWIYTADLREIFSKGVFFLQHLPVAD
jgi:hypothetical protein